MAPLLALRRLALCLITVASVFILIASIYGLLHAYSDHLSRIAEAPRIRAEDACLTSHFGSPALHRLTEARGFDLGGAWAPHEDLQLWFILVLKPNKAKQELEKLYSSGNPQAMSYALAGMRKVDRKRFAELLISARMSDLTVATLSGCFGPKQKLSEIAADLDSEKYDHWLHGLTEARVFAIGPVGYEEATSQEELHLMAILALKPDEAKQELEKLYSSGNPQAMSYALAGMRKLDRTRYTELLVSARASDLTVETLSGCMGSTLQLSEIATELDSGKYDGPLIRDLAYFRVVADSKL